MSEPSRQNADTGRKKKATAKAIRRDKPATAPPDDTVASLRRANAKLQRQLDKRTTERDDAEAQKAAMSEVLEVINASPGDLAPVFDGMLERAMRLCEAAFGQIATFDGEFFEFVALKGDARWLDRHPRGRLPPSKGLTWPRIASGEPFVQIADAKDTAAYRSGLEMFQNLVDSGGRTFLTVALRREHALVGALTIYRQEVRPFTDKQIALLQNFAAQAVIAMENARLLTETREALDRQTATAEVLQVINSSPGDLAPVFDAMLDKATRLCEAAFGVLWTYDGERFAAVALQNVPIGYADFLREPQRAASTTVIGQLAAGKAVAQIDDIATDEYFQTGGAMVQQGLALGGFRTVLGVALRKDEALLGAITIYRQHVQPFPEKQIALLQNFAQQAVIAMENARLITETREALDQQTATAEVLGVINSSPGDLTPVFEAILEKAMSRCEAAFGIMATYDGQRFTLAAVRDVPEALAAYCAKGMDQPQPGDAHWRLLRGEDLVHILDSKDDEAYRSGTPLRRAFVDLGGTRTSLVVPLRKDGVLLGTLTLYRKEVRPFTDRQIALVQNFAAQAVIAIENARLITETREALDQQTATAEVLGVINSSPGDLVPVFDAMLERALSLCDAAFGSLMSYDGEVFRQVAQQNFPPELSGIGREARAQEGSLLHQLIDGENLVVVDDIAASSRPSSLGGRAALVAAGAHSVLWVALRRENALVGAITIYRSEVRSFSNKEISLLQNFAAQAVIAMENARLITETQEALDRQTATAEVLGVINSSPGDLAPVFDAMLTKALHLCEAAFGQLWTYDGARFEMVASRGVPAEYAKFMLGPQRLGPGTAHGRIVAGESTVHITDLAAEEAYRLGDPHRRATVDIAGARSLLGIALRHDEQLLGVLMIYRQEVQPYSDKQIALLQNFAAQAVIAMENARLITETREALEQQTATSEVLGVINASPGDLQPVFDAMLEKAMHLSESVYGHLLTYDGEFFDRVAVRGEPGMVERQSLRRRAESGITLERILRGEAVVQIVDVMDTDAYRTGNLAARVLVDEGGCRSLLTVALRKDDTLLGTLSVYRRGVRPYSDKHVALLQNFAAQAVIAIENARLITETQEALEQQTAVSDVLKVISRSTFDLQPVLDTLVETAARLCEAESALILRPEGEVYRAVASFAHSPEFDIWVRKQIFTLDRSSITGRCVLERAIVHVADIAADPEYAVPNYVTLGKARTVIGVPLMRNGEPIGVITLSRQRVEPFSDRQIELVTTFADQAGIAIENTRLITETREALEQQTCSGSSTRRPVTWHRCLMPCWTRQQHYWEPISDVS